MKTLEQPKRRCTIDISIGADTREDAVRLLDEWADLIRRGGNSSVTGGYSLGGTYTVVERPHVTHDTFFTELDAYLAQEKQ